MKIRLLIILLTFGVFVFTSCNNDDDASPLEPLNGTWNLKNIVGGFAGIDDDYETGMVTWTFYTQNSTLQVENNTNQETIYSGFETGNYSYTSVQNNGNEYILINDEEYGGYLIDVDGLVINQNEIQDGVGSDGFILKFER